MSKKLRIFQEAGEALQEAQILEDAVSTAILTLLMIELRLSRSGEPVGVADMIDSTRARALSVERNDGRS
ncbi:hypothetical protein [Roseivivax halodurans]|uniref:hypothetical protein n=1 Tax=Roseivivax halodurans TaxID=93683 RepID=UPI0012FBB8E3|nr:hypothetical protein [Roseivivax halodurans]